MATFICLYKNETVIIATVSYIIKEEKLKY